MKQPRDIVEIDYLVEIGIIGRRNDVVYVTRDYNKALSEVQKYIAKFEEKLRKAIFGNKSINFKKLRENLWSDSGKLEHDDLYIVIRKFKNGRPTDKWLLI